MSDLSLIQRLKRRFLCPRGFHVGNFETHGEHVYLRCRRCDDLTHPMPRKQIRRAYPDEFDFECDRCGLPMHHDGICFDCREFVDISFRGDRDE